MADKPARCRGRVAAGNSQRRFLRIGHVGLPAVPDLLSGTRPGALRAIGGAAMRNGSRFDVVVAGGGVAGSAAAAALSGLGYEVAIVEPGMDASRRLAGELIHPTGVAALAELGLLDAVRGEDRSSVTGFSLRFGGAADAKVVRLPYGKSAHAAIAVEHGIMRQRLLNAAARLKGVTLLDRSRIVSVDPAAAPLR